MAQENEEGQPQPGLDLTPEEQAAAAAAEAEPMTLELPPQMVSGILVYEMEDGSWGFRPLSEGMKLLDVIGLLTKALEGARADLFASRVMQMMQTQQAAADKRPRIVLPGRKR
jgi:hypothetical protein